MTISGGCLCGQIRYELLAEPVFLTDCHCVDCRRSAGAPYVSWGSVQAEHLRIVAGRVKKVSHASRVRVFAECCGTQLFFEDETPEWVALTLASLDDPSKYAPKKAIWTEDKLPWIALDPHLPSFPRSRDSSG